MKEVRAKNLALLVITAFILSTLHLPVYAGEIGPLGEVVSTGEAEVMTSSGDWSVMERAYPVLPGSTYRTGAGGLSFILSDGSRLEVGNQSELSITGERGRYSIRLARGGVAFNVTAATDLVIRTPDAVVEAPFDREEPMINRVASVRAQTIGAVLYDGGKTEVIGVEGDVRVKGIASGSGTVRLSAGKSINIYPGGDYSILLAQAIGPEARVIDERNWIVSGGVSLEEVSRLTGTKLESARTNQIGDFVLDLLKKRPKKGDVTEYEDLKFEVLEVKGEHVLLVKIFKEKKVGALLFPTAADKILAGVTGAVIVGGAIYAIERGKEEGKRMSPHMPQ